MNDRMSKRDKITLAIFVFVTITAGPIGYLIDRILTEQPEGYSLGMGLWLVLPFLIGMILRMINKDLKELGYKPNIKNNLKWYALAVFVFPCTTLFCILVAKICGVLIVGEVEVSELLILVLITFLGNGIKNIFEEFAWRGCLVPYLEKTRMNDWFLYLSSGLIWGLWHITYYAFFLPNENFVESSRTMMVLTGIILMIFWSPLFVELRRITNSVWPCVILHAMQCAVPTLLFVTTDVFRLKPPLVNILDPVSGIVSTTLVLFVGLVLRRCRVSRELVQNKKEVTV